MQLVCQCCPQHNRRSDLYVTSRGERDGEREWSFSEGVQQRVNTAVARVYCFLSTFSLAEVQVKNMENKMECYVAQSDKGKLV
jgi:hypothetical protein